MAQGEYLLLSWREKNVNQTLPCWPWMKRTLEYLKCEIFDRAHKKLTSGDTFGIKQMKATYRR